MKLWKAIRVQSVDFIVFLALPLASVFLPASWSRALLARSSTLSWILSMEAEAAFSSASQYVDAGDEKTWKARWKQVEMLDIRDTYMMSFGRAGSVLGEIECDQPLNPTLFYLSTLTVFTLYGFSRGSLPECVRVYTALTESRAAFESRKSKERR